MAWTREAEGWMIMNEPLWGPGYVERHLGLVGRLSVFYIPAYKALTSPGNQEADTLSMTVTHVLRVPNNAKGKHQRNLESPTSVLNQGGAGKLIILSLSL